jgi:hypothetical protein
MALNASSSVLMSLILALSNCTSTCVISRLNNYTNYILGWVVFVDFVYILYGKVFIVCREYFYGYLGNNVLFDCINVVGDDLTKFGFYGIG